MTRAVSDTFIQRNNAIARYADCIDAGLRVFRGESISSAIDHLQHGSWWGSVGPVDTGGIETIENTLRKMTEGLPTALAEHAAKHAIGSAIAKAIGIPKP